MMDYIEFRWRDTGKGIHQLTLGGKVFAVVIEHGDKWRGWYKTFKTPSAITFSRHSASLKQAKEQVQKRFRAVMVKRLAWLLTRSE
jgi:hypothetical protein